MAHPLQLRTVVPGHGAGKQSPEDADHIVSMLQGLWRRPAGRPAHAQGPVRTPAAYLTGRRDLAGHGHGHGHGCGYELQGQLFVEENLQVAR